MKTQGEIEAAICEGISRFEQDYMGRGPKDIHAHLLGDLLVVRLQGVLTAAEQHLVKSLPAEKGRDLLKQVRTHLIETARPCHGSDGPGDHRRQGLEPAPRHQHRNRRGGHSLDPGRVANSPRRKEEIAVLVAQGIMSSIHKRFATTRVATRRGDQPPLSLARAWSLMELWTTKANAKSVKKLRHREPRRFSSFQSHR